MQCERKTKQIRAHLSMAGCDYNPTGQLHAGINDCLTGKTPVRPGLSGCSLGSRERSLLRGPLSLPGRSILIRANADGRATVELAPPCRILVSHNAVKIMAQSSIRKAPRCLQIQIQSRDFGSYKIAETNPSDENMTSLVQRQMMTRS